MNETPDFLVWSAKVWGDDGRGEFIVFISANNLRPELLLNCRVQGPWLPGGQRASRPKQPVTLRMDADALAAMAPKDNAVA